MSGVGDPAPRPEDGVQPSEGAVGGNTVDTTTSDSQSGALGDDTLRVASQPGATASSGGAPASTSFIDNKATEAHAMDSSALANSGEDAGVPPDAKQNGSPCGDSGTGTGPHGLNGERSEEDLVTKAESDSGKDAPNVVANAEIQGGSLAANHTKESAVESGKLGDSGVCEDMVMEDVSSEPHTASSESGAGASSLTLDAASQEDKNDAIKSEETATTKPVSTADINNGGVAASTGNDPVNESRDGSSSALLSSRNDMADDAAPVPSDIDSKPNTSAEHDSNNDADANGANGGASNAAVDRESENNAGRTVDEKEASALLAGMNGAVVDSSAQADAATGEAEEQEDEGNGAKTSKNEVENSIEVPAFDGGRNDGEKPFGRTRSSSFDLRDNSSDGMPERERAERTRSSEMEVPSSTRDAVRPSRDEPKAFGASMFADKIGVRSSSGAPGAPIGLKEPTGATATATSFLDSLSEEERRVRTRHIPSVDGFRKLYKSEIRRDMAMARGTSTSSGKSNRGRRASGGNSVENENEKEGGAKKTDSSEGDKMDTEEDGATGASDDETTSDLSGGGGRASIKPSQIDSAFSGPSSAFAAPPDDVVSVLTGGGTRALGENEEDVDRRGSPDVQGHVRSPHVVESITAFNPPRPPESIGSKKKHRLMRWERNPQDVEGEMINYKKTVQRTREELHSAERERERIETVGAHLRSHFMTHLQALREESSQLDEELNALQIDCVKAADLLSSKTRSRGMGKGSNVMRDVLTILKARGDKLQDQTTEATTETMPLSVRDRIGEWCLPGIGGACAIPSKVYSVLNAHGSLARGWILPGDRVSTPFGEGDVLHIIGPGILDVNEPPQTKVKSSTATPVASKKKSSANVGESGNRRVANRHGFGGSKGAASRTSAAAGKGTAAKAGTSTTAEKMPRQQQSQRDTVETKGQSGDGSQSAKEVTDKVSFLPPRICVVLKFGLGYFSPDFVKCLEHPSTLNDKELGLRWKKMDETAKLMGSCLDTLGMEYLPPAERDVSSSVTTQEGLESRDSKDADNAGMDEKDQMSLSDTKEGADTFPDGTTPSGEIGSSCDVSGGANLNAGHTVAENKGVTKSTTTRKSEENATSDIQMNEASVNGSGHRVENVSSGRMFEGESTIAPHDSLEGPKKDEQGDGDTQGVHREDNKRKRLLTFGSGMVPTPGSFGSTLAHAPLGKLEAYLAPTLFDGSGILGKPTNPSVPLGIKQWEKQKYELHSLSGKVLQLRNRLYRQRRIRMLNERSYLAGIERAERGESLLLEMKVDLKSLKERLQDELVELGIDQERAEGLLAAQLEKEGHLHKLGTDVLSPMQKRQKKLMSEPDGDGQMDASSSSQENGEPGDPQIAMDSNLGGVDAELAENSTSAPTSTVDRDGFVEQDFDHEGSRRNNKRARSDAEPINDGGEDGSKAKRSYRRQ